MKLKNLVIFLLPISMVCCKGARTGSHSEVIKKEDCYRSLDSLYDHSELLSQLATVLNENIPEYEVETGNLISYDKEDCSLKGYEIYDLMDTLNHSSLGSVKIDFINYHVYHFYAVYPPLSFSNIAVLVDGKVKVFEKINCANSQNTLNDVLSYVGNLALNKEEKESLLRRVKNFRSYGEYGRIDDIEFVLDCK